MSAFAAVAGLLLLLSGVFTTSYLTGATSSAPAMTAQQPGATLPHTDDTNQPAPAFATPTAPAEQQIVQATGVATIQATATRTAQPRTPSPSVARPFLDLGTIAGRMSVGFLLLLLGLIGVIVFRKRRYQQEILS